MEQQTVNQVEALAQVLATIQAQLHTLGDKMTHLEQLKAPPPLRRAATRNVPFHHDAMEDDNMLGFEEDIRKPPDPPYPPARRRDHDHRWRIREEEPPLMLGSSDPKTYLAWELHMEELFCYYNYTNSRKVAVAAARLMGDALTWWNREASERRRHKYTQISTWEEMKQHLRKRYVPYSFRKNFTNCFDRPIPRQKAVQQRPSSTPYLDRPTHLILPKEYGKDHGIDGHNNTQTCFLNPHEAMVKAKDKMNISNQSALHESQESFKQKDVQEMAIQKVSSNLNQNLLIYPMTSIMHLSLPKEADNYAGNKEKYINEQTLVPSSVCEHHDEVMCDVVPMQASHLLLWIPWQFDRKTTHDGQTNLYPPTFDKRSSDLELPNEVFNLSKRFNNTFPVEQYQIQDTKSCKNVTFDPGKWVWLHMRPERVPQKRSFMLVPRGDGPFKLLEKINENAYRLELPGEFNISTTFNVADLARFDVGQPVLRSKLFEEGGNDEDIAIAKNFQAPTLPNHPMTRSRAKKLQDAFKS